MKKKLMVQRGKTRSEKNEQTNLPQRLSPFLRLSGARFSDKRVTPRLPTSLEKHCRGGSPRALLLRYVLQGFGKLSIISGSGGILLGTGEILLDLGGSVDVLSGKVEGDPTIAGLTGVQSGGPPSSPGTGIRT